MCAQWTFRGVRRNHGGAPQLVSGRARGERCQPWCGSGCYVDPYSVSYKSCGMCAVCLLGFRVSVANVIKCQKTLIWFQRAGAPTTTTDVMQCNAVTRPNRKNHFCQTNNTRLSLESSTGLIFVFKAHTMLGSV